MKKLFSILAAFIPAVIAYLALWKTRDALVSLILLIVLGFVAPIIVYIKAIGEFNYELKLPEELLKKDEKIALGKNLLLGGIFGTAILVIVWTKFAPSFAVTTAFTFPLPLFSSTGVKIAYHIFFTLFFLIAAILEHLYFNYFFCTTFNEKESVGGGKLGALASTAVSAATGEAPSFFSNLILSLGVGLLNFAIFRWTVTPTILSAVVLAVITFLINFVIFGIRSEKKMIVSTLLRVGIAIGVLLILLYLGLSVNKEWKRKTPDFVFVGTPDNLLAKWLAKAPAAAVKKLL